MPDSGKQMQEIKKLLAQKNIRTGVFVCGVVCILLLAVPSLFPSEKKTAVAEEATSAAEDAALYTQMLEQQMTVLIGAITGESAPKVLIVPADDGKNIYAQNEKQTGSYLEKSCVLVKKSDGTQQPVLLTHCAPTVASVVVVSAKASSASVREAVTQAVTTALGISSTQVCVVPKGGNNPAA